MSADFLQKLLDEEPHENYPAESRVHPLNSFPNCFVKRDDELGFSISGTKFRKYRMLLPHLRGNAEVNVVGGPFSNHVLAITQLLIENGIRPKLYLKGPPPSQMAGNYLYLQMLVNPSEICWIPKSEWPPQLPEQATLPEGAALFPAFLGALTLPLDILRNEREMGIAFDHIFLDAGTGYSAAALLLGLAFLEKKTDVHLLLLAGTEESFCKELRKLHAEFEQWLGKECPYPNSFTCTTPTIAPSFGSTNAALFDFLTHIARTEGFFLDPIYSGKLFYHAHKQIPSLNGNILIVHSGGALTLSGFGNQLDYS